MFASLRNKSKLLADGKTDHNAAKQQPSPASSSTTSDSRLVVPETLHQPLNQLLDLIVRDFITDWYSKYVSLGDARFPLECRHTLNAVSSALVMRIHALHRKETAIFLTSSASAAIVREMQGVGTEETKESIVHKLRNIAEELLHTCSPPHAVASPAATALLSEILVLQLWKVVESVDSDYINQTIISFLKDDNPSLREQVTEKAQDLVELQPDQPTSQAQAVGAGAVAAKDIIFSQVTSALDAAVPADSPSRIPPAPAPSALAEPSRAPSPPPKSPTPLGPGLTQSTVPTAGLAALPDIVALKKSLNGTPETADAMLVQADIFYQQHPEPVPEHDDPLLRSILDGSRDFLGEQFQDYLEGLEGAPKTRGRLLERMYGRTMSIHKMLAAQSSDPPRQRQDALEMLAQFVESLKEFWTDAALASVLYACMSRIHRKDVQAFVPLQLWIQDQLDVRYFRPFIRSVESDEGMDLTSSTPVPPQEKRGGGGGGGSGNLSRTSSLTKKPAAPYDQRAAPPATTHPAHSKPKARQQSDHSTHSTGMSHSNASETSIASSFDLSTINVQLTDISEPSAYDPSTQRVKNKRELTFFVALELTSGAPGYIIQRSFKEMESLDNQLTKLFPDAGSLAFPRAMLPSPNFKTSDLLTRELEGFLNHLLSDHRYAPSMPVQEFFQKERAGAAAPGMSLWDLGKNAHRASQTIAKGGDAVLNQVGSVFSGFKNPAEVPKYIARSGSGSSGQDEQHYQQLQSAPSHPGSHALNTATSRSSENTSRVASPRTSLEVPRAVHSSPDVRRQAPSSNPSKPSSLASETSPRPSSESLPNVERNASATASSASRQHGRKSSSSSKPVRLTPNDMDHIISSALAVLEEAYLLTNGQWSFKRGLLKVIETVVRNSYAGLIGAAFLETIHSINTESSAEQIIS